MCRSVPSDFPSNMQVQDGGIGGMGVGIRLAMGTRHKVLECALIGPAGHSEVGLDELVIC